MRRGRRGEREDRSEGGERAAHHRPAYKAGIPMPTGSAKNR
jgi:hypothetical protein